MYYVIILPSWNMVVLHVKQTDRYTSMQQGCTNPAGITAYLQLCDHLVTTLKPACGRDKSRVWTRFWQGCHNLVTTLYQPCKVVQPSLNHVLTTLWPACINLVTTWLQGSGKVGTRLSVTRLSQPSFFYMGKNQWDCEISNYYVALPLQQ